MFLFLFLVGFKAHYSFESKNQFNESVPSPGVAMLTLLS